MEFGKRGTPTGVHRPMARTPGRKMTVREQRTAARLYTEQDSEYPSALQMYDRPPHCDVSLQDFEDMAVERLKVLRTFEKHNMGGNTKFSSEWSDKIKDDLDKHNLSEYYDLANTLGVQQKAKHIENRKRDHISHFILRLAYCRSDELRRWYVTHETDLFRFRWRMLFKDNAHLLNQFMSACKLVYEPISQEEKESLGEDLINGTNRGISAHKVNDDDFYKVPWLEAMDLVRARRVLVRGGYAFIPREELISLVVGVFRQQLSHNLVLTCRALPVLEEDRRLVSLLQNMDKRYTGEDFGSNKSGDRVTPEQVANMADTHFPMCMQSLHSTLNGQHHLKYKARIQYGLFLKGIGMTLEDSIRFWRTELTKRGEVDVDKFEKEYAYGIRYNYGKEGKKKNWQPWDCMRIIMENVGAGESHGCPFRHHEGKILRKELEKGIKPAELDVIMKKVNEGHFQVACGMHFSAMHARDLTTGVTNHPNQWYLESRNMLGNNQSDGLHGGNKIKTTHVSVYNKNSQTGGSQQQSQAEAAAETKEAFMDELMDDSELLSALDSVPVGKK